MDTGGSVKPGADGGSVLGADVTGGSVLCGFGVGAEVTGGVVVTVGTVDDGVGVGGSEEGVGDGPVVGAGVGAPNGMQTSPPGGNGTNSHDARRMKTPWRVPTKLESPALAWRRIYNFRKDAKRVKW